MKKSRSAKKPQPSPWIVALDAARNYAAGCLDPSGEASQERRWACLDDVITAVVAQSAPTDKGSAIVDQLTDARALGAEAGFLFGVALASVLRGPWDTLSLWQGVSGRRGVQ